MRSSRSIVGPGWDHDDRRRLLDTELTQANEQADEYGEQPNARIMRFSRGLLGFGIGR